MALCENMDLLPERSIGSYRRLDAVPEPGAEDILKEGASVGASDASRNVTGSVLCFQNPVKMG